MSKMIISCPFRSIPGRTPNYQESHNFGNSATIHAVTVGKVRAPNSGSRLGAPNMNWPHNWWLIQAVKRGVDSNEHCIYAALIISVSENNLKLFITCLAHVYNN
jgi:hypothetical protein